MATLNFDATTVAPSAPAGIVPAGDYNVQIVKSEVKPTRDATGHYLTLEFEILDGEFKNRHLWTNLNIWNQNETACRIAQQQLSAIAHAVGVLQVADSELLHNKPLMVNVVVKAGTEQYPDSKNEVKGFAAYKGAAANAAPAPVAPSFAPAANPFSAPAQAPAAPIVPQAAPAPSFAAPVAPVPAPAGAPSFAPPAPVAPVANPFAAPAAPGAAPAMPWGVKS